MSNRDPFTVEVQSNQSTLEAIDTIRELFELQSRTQSFSKKDFARWLGKDPSYVSRILNGRASNINYKTIAQMLIVLGYLPKLEVDDINSCKSIPNFIHSEVVDDDYVRSSNGQWSTGHLGEDKKDVSLERAFQKVVP